MRTSLNINSNLTTLLARVGGSVTVSIAANSYKSVQVPITVPDGYTLVSELGYATNNLYVVVYNLYKVAGANTITIGIKNNASSTQSITVHTYGLCIKSTFA